MLQLVSFCVALIVILCCVIKKELNSRLNYRFKCTFIFLFILIDRGDALLYFKVHLFVGFYL